MRSTRLVRRGVVRLRLGLDDARVVVGLDHALGLLLGRSGRDDGYGCAAIGRGQCSPRRGRTGLPRARAAAQAFATTRRNPPQPGSAGGSAYNSMQSTRCVLQAAAPGARLPAKEPATMAHATATADRQHVASKRYIYAWGAGTAEGNGDDEGPARRQGRGPRRDDARRPADPARLHDHDGGLQRLLRRRQAAARTASGTTSSRRCKEVEQRTGKGFGDPANPLLVSGPLRRQVLDARDDGHGPQPGPQRGDAPRPDRADRQRALRLGRLPPVHRDVRPDRDGREGRAVRRAARGAQGRATARTPRTPT